MDARRGPDGPAGGGRIRRPTRAGRGDAARLERLSAYVDGWTTDRERAAVERELSADPTAREALDGLRLVRTALANLEMPRAPRSFALLVAPARHSPFALFRRLEWATRGAAGVAALAFAVALVRAPQVGEVVTSAAPVAAQERAPAAAAPVEVTPVAKARETATQTLSVAPSPTAVGGGATGGAPAVVPALAPASVPAPASPTPAAAPPPAAPAPATADATPAAGPRSLLAPAPTATPATTSAAPTPAPTVEATRLVPTPAPSPALAAPVVTATPEPAPTPAVTSAKSADAASAPLPPSGAPPASGTTPPATASDDAGETDVAPALGVLALLLVLMATIQRVGGPPHDGA